MTLRQQPTPPLPTPPEVFDAMEVVAAHLRRRGYVDVLIGSTGGAIFYRESPLARTQELYREIDRLMGELEKGTP